MNDVRQKSSLHVAISIRVMLTHQWLLDWWRDLWLCIWRSSHLHTLLSTFHIDLWSSLIPLLGTQINFHHIQWVAVKIPIIVLQLELDQSLLIFSCILGWFALLLLINITILSAASLSAAPSVLTAPVAQNARFQHGGWYHCFVVVDVSIVSFEGCLRLIWCNGFTLYFSALFGRTEFPVFQFWVSGRCGSLWAII